MIKDPENKSWANPLRSDQEPGQDRGPSKWDGIVAKLAGIADFATGFIADQVYLAGQDVVSRFLLNESFHGKEPEPERESARDRNTDDGMDR